MAKLGAVVLPIDIPASLSQKSFWSGLARVLKPLSGVVPAEADPVDQFSELVADARGARSLDDGLTGVLDDAQAVQSNGGARRRRC